MLSPYNAAPFKEFDPFPKCPAKLLTQYLPPNVNANCLLLSCGDPIHILYTVHRENFGYFKRDLDFTCCDEEPAILARNVLFYTMILDDAINEIEGLQIFYTSLIAPEKKFAVIRQQCQKLLSLSVSLRDWERSEYGDLIMIGNSDSLNDIRHCWLQYCALDGVSNHLPWASELSILATKRYEDHLNIGCLASAFGALEMVSATQANQLGSYFWGHNTIDEESEETEETRVNPLFMYSFGARHRFALSRSSIPHKGFHLALSCPSVNVTPDSPYSNFKRVPYDDPSSAIQFEFAELSVWMRSFKSCARNAKSRGTSLRIRIFVGDPCGFAFALRQRETKSVPNGLNAYIQPWTGKSLDLDGKCYMTEGPSSAPLRYNVIDGSNTIDKVGLLNFLVSVIPLLEQSPSATITTDTTYYPELQGRETELLAELLGGNVGHICSLLGVAPLSYVTGIATGDQHDSPPTIGIYGFMERIIWKLTLLGDPVATPETAQLTASPDDLANLLLNVYLSMPHYDDYLPRIHAIAKRKRDANVLKLHPPQTTRRGFAAFLAFLKPRISVNWESMTSILLSKIKSLKPSQHEDITCSHLYDLYLDLHLFGVCTINNLLRQPNLGNPFGIMTCVIATVHRPVIDRWRQRFNFVEQLFLALQLHLVIPKTADTPEEHNAFSSTVPIFGKLISFDNDDFKFEIDQQGWEGKSDLHVCAYVPTHILFDPDGKLRNITLSVGFMPEYTTITGFSDVEMGYSNTSAFLAANITDENHVRLLKTFPGLPRPSPAVVPSRDQAIASHDDLVEISNPVADFSGSTFTTRITIKQPNQNPKLIQNVALKGTSPCSAHLSLNEISYRCTFPFPIADNVNLRRSKTAGWIEVIAQMSDPTKSGGYYTKPFPVIQLGKTFVNWNFPSIHFGQVPKLKFRRSDSHKWVELNLGSMFSDAELPMLNTIPGTCSGITEYKRSIKSIFMDFVSSGTRIFKIQSHIDASPSIVLFLTGIFLDEVGRTILAEAYAILWPVPNPSHQNALERLCRDSVKLVVGNEGILMWESSLHGMIERCRDFQHANKCALNSNTASFQTTIVGCGCQTIGVEFLEFKGVSSLCNYAMRLVIGPIYSPRFVVESRKFYRQNVIKQLDKISKIPKPPPSFCERPGCDNYGTMKCGRCEQVRYCSKECQRLHWKRHKTDCVPRTNSSK